MLVTTTALHEDNLGGPWVVELAQAVTAYVEFQLRGLVRSDGYRHFRDQGVNRFQLLLGQMLCPQLISLSRVASSTPASSK